MKINFILLATDVVVRSSSKREKGKIIRLVGQRVVLTRLAGRSLVYRALSCCELLSAEGWLIGGQREFMTLCKTSLSSYFERSI